MPPHPHRSLRVEALEDRTVPAVDNTFVIGLTGGPFQSTIRVLDGFTNLPRYPDYVAFIGYNGPIAVAAGDVNNDGVGDVIVAAQNNQGHIKAFDGQTQQLLYSIAAFPFFGGTVSAASGDVDGDGYDDLIIAADNANAHVRVYSGRDGRDLASFLAFNPYLGTVSVAAADFNTDGRAEIIVAAGAPGTNGLVALFNRDGTVFNFGFSAFIGFGGRINVTAGDVNGDLAPDIIVGAVGAAGGHVKAFSGFGLSYLLLDSFFAYELAYTAGVNVGVADANRDGRLEIRTSPVGGRLTEIRTFDGLNGVLIQSFVAFPDHVFGASIAGTG